MAKLTQDELVEAALAKAEGNKRRLSRETGLDYDYVLRWSAGGTGFKFDTTIALLEYLGWLRVAEPADSSTTPVWRRATCRISGSSCSSWAASLSMRGVSRGARM